MIFTAFIIACGVYVFIHVAEIPSYIKIFLYGIFGLELKRLKPFDCEGCLGFWLGAIVFFIQTQDIWIIVSGACISSVFSVALYLILRRL